MRLISFEKNGRTGFGAVKGDDVVDLTGKIGGATDLMGVLAADALDAVRAHVASAAPDFPLASCRLLPVIPQPSKIICVGINYVAHAAEAGRTVGKHPVIFHRFADTLVAAGAPLIRPKVSDQLDYEGELAVVIGRGGGHISEADAMSHVAGYTGFQDATPRDWQFHTHQYGMGKNFRGTGGLGPWLVTADEILDYRKIELRTVLNGKELQHGTLDQLAFDVPALISYVSKALDWRPGDILATGTPSGVGFKRTPPVFMKAGDRVDVVISQIGTLSNPVVDEE